MDQTQGVFMDLFLSTLPSVLFARGTTFALRTLGYQVLDSPGTSALKAACDNKPAAASIVLGSKPSDPWILSGPTMFSGKDFNRMGFSAFYSLTNSTDKKASLYFPLFLGNKEGKTGGPVRINAVQSPMYKLPTRMVLNVVEKDEIEARMEWQSDTETCKAHNTAVWVMQDRYLNQTMKLSSESMNASLQGMLINVLQCRLNLTKESSGSLWWADQPDVVVPWAAGMAYKITGVALPLFSSSATDWNRAALDAASSFKPPEFPASTRVDYLTITPKFLPERHLEYLKSFPNGFDDIENTQDWRVWAGFVYAFMCPKEMAASRVVQLSEKLWLFASGALTTPAIKAPSRGGPKEFPVFKCDPDGVSLRAMLAYNLSNTLSMSTGVLQKASLPLSIPPPHQIPPVTLGKTTWLASLQYSFSGGHIQCALEGVSRVAAMVEYRAGSVAAPLSVSVGAKWDREAVGRKLSYGMGMSWEF